MPHTIVILIQHHSRQKGRLGWREVGNSLVDGGHRYKIRTRKTNTTYWVCSESPYTRWTAPQLRESRSHTPAKKSTDRRHEDIRDDEVALVPTIYTEEAVKLRKPERNKDIILTTEELPTFTAAKSILYRQRSLTRPPLPKTVHDLDLQGDCCLTTADDLSNDIFPAILPFSTISNLQRLALADTIFCNGTLCICPSLPSTLLYPMFRRWLHVPTCLWFPVLEWGRYYLQVFQPHQTQQLTTTFNINHAPPF